MAERLYMEAAKLVVSIILCLSVIAIGGGLLAAMVWLGLKLRPLTELFERVIDNEAAIAAQCDELVKVVGEMVKVVSELKSTTAELLKNLDASQQAVVKIMATNIVGVEGLAKAVQVFQKSLLSSVAANPTDNYGVDPDLSGETQEEREKRQADEILKATTSVRRVYDSHGPEIMSTE